MKLRNFIYGLMAVAGFAACQPEDTNLGVPDIEVSAEEIAVEETVEAVQPAATGIEAVAEVSEISVEEATEAPVETEEQ